MRTCVDAGDGSSIGRFDGVAPTCERKQMKHVCMYSTLLVCELFTRSHSVMGSKLIILVYIAIN